MSEKEVLKCVVIGDATVGKTCLLIRYAKDEFPSGYVPTIFDSYSVSLPVGDETFELSLFDTAGQEDYDQLRKLAFTDADIFLVCFAVNLRTSYDHLKDMWIPELKKYCPGVPFLIVGTKIDLRNDSQTEKVITKDHGEKLARELRAIKYLECSALTKENVNDVFQEAIIAAISDDHQPPESKPTARATPASTSVTVSNTNYKANDTSNDEETCSCCVIS